MTRTRWLITLFWLFIGGMLLWQFSSYNQHLDQDAIEHPQQQHFFFYPTNQASGVTVEPTAVVDGPNVQQERYWTEDKTPTPNNFVAHFILKNVGNAKAVSIQIMIRPYSGTTVGDEDNGHSQTHILSDSDPLSQLGQVVDVPDLAPGEESAVQNVTFFKQGGAPLGSNPHPAITFQRDQASPAATPASTPTPTPARQHDN